MYMLPTFDTFELFGETPPGHRLRPPQSAETLLSTRQSSRELVCAELYPLTGGLSGSRRTKVVSLLLNSRKSSIVVRWPGMTFQSLGPITAIELSYWD